jgi:hypothetical protein
MMLELLLFAIITIIIDHAWTENWDDLCYPPVNNTLPKMTGRKPR